MIRGKRMTDKEYKRFLFTEFTQAEDKINQAINNIEPLLKELVSTIRDECSGVGLEIGTNPKRKASQQ